jgi:hypothetical protein
VGLGVGVGCGESGVGEDESGGGAEGVVAEDLGPEGGEEWAGGLKGV